MGKMVGLRQQGTWTRWEFMVNRKVEWHDDVAIKFLIRSFLRPVNIHLWKKTKFPSCQLCGCIGSLKHILSCYLIARADGHYRWHHDQIFKKRQRKLSGRPSVQINQISRKA